MTLRCTYPGCDVVIARPNPRRKTTMCRAHATAAAAQCPVKREKTAASMRATIASRPGYRQECSARARQVMAGLMSDPEVRQRYVENGRRLGYDYRGNLFRSREERLATAARESAKRLEHIPLEYRDLYRSLKRQNLTAAEREQAVRTQMEVDRRLYEKTGMLPRTGGTR